MLKAVASNLACTLDTAGWRVGVQSAVRNSLSNREAEKETGTKMGVTDIAGGGVVCTMCSGGVT